MRGLAGGLHGGPGRPLHRASQHPATLSPPARRPAATPWPHRVQEP